MYTQDRYITDVTQDKLYIIPRMGGSISNLYTALSVYFLSTK